MEDGKIVQTASSGLALCGIRMDGTRSAGISQLIGRPVKQLLQCPSQCQLHAPIDAHHQLTLEFSSKTEIVQFLDAAAESGWMAALNLFSLGDAQIHHNNSRSTSSVLDSTAAERCTVEICYAPASSFRIEQQQMQLSEAALSDLRGVETLSRAQEFLDQYHSHVSTGVFHLGAVYAKWTMCGQWAQKSGSTEGHVTALTGSAGLDNLAAHIKAAIGFHRQKQATVTEKASKVEDAKSCITWVLGGPPGAITDSINTFLKSVEASPSSWAIINSTCTSQTLVAVWDLVFKTCDESLWKPAELLRESWQSAVAEIVNDDEVFKLHQASLMCTSSADIGQTSSDSVLQFNITSSKLVSPNSKEISPVVTSRTFSSRRILESGICWLPKESCSNDGEDNYPRISTEGMDNFESMPEPDQVMNEDTKMQLALLAKPETSSIVGMMQEEVSGYTQFHKHPRFTYINDFLTHRPFPQPDQYKNLIDRISHAMIPFENFKQQLADEDEFWGAACDAGSSCKDENTKASSSGGTWEHPKSQIITIPWDAANTVQGACPNFRCQEEDPVIEEADTAKSIVYVYENSDFLGQIALLRLLLDQRWGVPLVFSSLVTKSPLSQNMPYFRTSIQALRFVFTRVGAYSSAEQLLLANGMHRVVFFSDHCNREHERMAEQVTKFRFLPFPYGAEGGALYIQFGIGFLPETNRRTPYLALVVSGAYATSEQCISFLNEVADVLFLQVCRDDMGSNVTTVFPALLTCQAATVRWAINSSGVSGRNPARKEIWGSSSDVAIDLTRYLQTKLSKMPLGARKDLKSICTTYFEAPKSDLNLIIQYPTGLEDTSRQTDFGTLRNELVLQTSFLREATARFEYLQLEHNTAKKQEKIRECIKETKKREQDAVKVSKIPIIQIFLRVLGHKESSTRSIGILKLKNSMQERSQRALLEWSEKVDSAFKRYQSSPSQETGKLYNSCRDQHAGMVIGLEHLWREVSHIFLANPSSCLELPKLAATHLLDGFPLEILDGNAKYFNDVWVKAVLLEAEKLIMEGGAHSSSPRILVLSILGTQSSGKTTLLNVMFGMNLPTKAGRCTSGVHIQLIKSGWCKYDYILVMDTEGITGPENFGEQQYLLHDNRLATFAILPSDACIMVVAGEDDSNLKDVLPLVLLAFKGSTAAQRSGGRLRSKMLFVYRSVDINEQGELRSNQQTLLKYLAEAERHISTRPEVEACHDPNGGSHGLGSAGALFEFHVDDEEELSDVKYLGNHRRDSRPPEDIPDSKYGEKVLHLSDYLHRRVTEDSRWRAFDFRELASYMKQVWSCILQADFELSFKSSVEYSSFMELQQLLQAPRTVVSRAYVEELEEMEGVDCASLNKLDNTRVERLEFCKVHKRISEQTEEVEKILENSRWLSAWKAEEGQKWKEFLEHQDRWFKVQLRDHETGVFLFEKLVTECDRKMQKDLIALRGLQHGDKQISFDTMFSSFLESAKQSYKPSAARVRELVDYVYRRHRGIFESVGIAGEDGPESDGFEETSFADIKETVLKPSLENARQYSDYLVEDAISATSEYIRNHPITYDEDQRRRRAQTHEKVKEFMTVELHKIQQKWDEEHNPAARLEKQRDRFHHLYKIHTNGYDMADLLVEELQSVFSESLETSLQEFIAKRSCSCLQEEQWLFNWRVMRRLLDALLLKLLEEKNDVHVLDYVANGCLYNGVVVEKLIKRNLTEIAKPSLHILRSAIKNSVASASESAVKSSAPGGGGTVCDCHLPRQPD